MDDGATGDGHGPTGATGGRTIVVGVLPEQPLWVVQVAADYARAFGAELVCVAVDQSRYAFQELPDGTLLTSPLDRDGPAEAPTLPPERLREIGEALSAVGVRWSVRGLVGVVADSLRRVADEVDALMIVVGTREPGFRGAMRSALTGSVAARLAHRQYRPVVVVPTAPAESDAALLSAG